MISDRNPLPSPVEPPADELPGQDVHGLTRGVVWSELAAEMRAEAAAAGDTRFAELDAMITVRRSTPYEAEPIDLERVRAERARRREGGERAA